MEKVSKEFQERFDRDIYRVYNECGTKKVELLYYVYQEGHKYPQVVWADRECSLKVPLRNFDEVLVKWENTPQRQADLDEDFPDVEDEITHLPVLDIEKVDEQTEDGIYLDIIRY